MHLSFSTKLATVATSTGHPRRRPSGTSFPTAAELKAADPSQQTSPTTGTAFGSQPRPLAGSLTPIPSTPTRDPTSHMSLSRTPSPNPDGGWSSRGLTTDERGSSYGGANTLNNMGDIGSDNDIQWAAARAKSQRVRGQQQPSIQTKNEGFFQRSRRKISQTLPLPAFHRYGPGSARKDWRESEKLGRGRWVPLRAGGSLARVKTFVGNVLRRFRVVVAVLLFLMACVVVLSQTDGIHEYRANASFGGGSNFVIILAANEGGGVMEWKGPKEWAIERDSVRNKKNYAKRWGYHLEVADMITKKRYAHEWRESWEKVDKMREAMAKYPKAEWFWWLDLNTFIMEPSISLQQHLFNSLATSTYRDINYYNPLNITHPPTLPILDPVTSSPTGDNLTSSIDLILSQDCGGFNLGSFFARRSEFTERLFDIWWDPVLYEQKHMEWEHKEQDALEHLYAAQPYLRSHIAFVDQRKINAFPPGACSVEISKEEKELIKEEKMVQPISPQFHYNDAERDFLVNMAGCEWGRDCWGEMVSYRKLSDRLNRNWWQKVQDALVDGWEGVYNAVTGPGGEQKQLKGVKRKL